MAYDLSERFPKTISSHKLLDPGSYQNTNSLVIKPNKVSFLSKTPRNTQSCFKVWTHAVYCGDIRPKIPNCTTISSKTPRFSYQNIRNENDNIQPLVCQCEIQNTCKCQIEEEKTDHEDEIMCHAAIRRRIFKGPTLHSELREEFSPSLGKDNRVKVLPNGKGSTFKQTKEECPPFYDARVVESNAFYRGCKWSRWTSQRSITTSVNQTPGPADYNINENQTSYEDKCAEKLRAFKRKTSKQLRFIEKIQRQHVLEALPGPADYSPSLPKGSDLKCVGPRAKRFVTPKYDVTPNPTTYLIKRDFDLNESCFKPCLANLPSRAPFTVKALRFKYRREGGPSPASYNINNISCRLKHCNMAPFGSFSKRFSESYEKDTQSYDDDTIQKDTVNEPHVANHLPTWVFRSKTVRMKPIIKMTHGIRSADLSLPRCSMKKRLLQFQYICPFFSSEARFRNWFNWIPIQGLEKTPCPAYYNLEKRTCLPAVRSGPTNRSDRFTSHISQTPAPNTYKVNIGIDNILTTHNQRLKNQIKNTHKYSWKVPVEKTKLSLNEQEIILLNKSIALLDVPDVFEYTKYETKNKAPPLSESKTKQSKLLRCFVYAKKVKQYY